MVAEPPTRPAWLAKELTRGDNPFQSLQEAHGDLHTGSDLDSEHEEWLALRIAHRKLMDQKINDALADDFWEDDCDDLCDDTDDEDDYEPIVGIKTLSAIAAEGALDQLPVEKKAGLLGHLPASFDNYQSMVDYLLDRKLNDQFLESRSEIQGSTIWHHQIAFEHGFDPMVISNVTRAGIIEITNRQMAAGKGDLESIQIAYRAIAMTLSTLERLKCFLIPYIGLGRLIHCAEWAIKFGETGLEQLSLPSVGKLLLDKPGRFVITYSMLSRESLLDREDEMLALRNNACFVVGENPFYARILIEKSAIDSGKWVEYSRQLRGNKPGYDPTDQNQNPQRMELMDSLRAIRDSKYNENLTRSFVDEGDGRSLFGNPRATPREVRLKTIRLQGRDTIMVGVPNGKQLCWFPQDLPDRKVPGPTLCNVDELGIPCADYAKDLCHADKLLHRLMDWLNTRARPLLLDKDLFNKVSDALIQLTEHPYHRSGMSLVNLATIVDISWNESPGRGVHRLLEYANGTRVPLAVGCFKEARWNQPYDVGWLMSPGSWSPDETEVEDFFNPEIWDFPKLHPH